MPATTPTVTPTATPIVTPTNVPTGTITHFRNTYGVARDYTILIRTRDCPPQDSHCKGGHISH
ncbi:hypothetical protein GBAR_LOCUS12943, partial [Geodia barretti]